MKKHHALLLPILAALLTLSACSIVPQQRKDARNNYSLEIPLPRQAAAADKAPLAILDIAPFAAAPECETRQLVISRAANRFTPDYYNQFIASPAQIIAHQTRLYFAAAGLAIIPTNNSKLRPTHRIEATLNALHADLREAGQAAAVLEIRIQLLDSRNHLLFEKTYAARQAAANNHAESIIAAHNKALAGILARQAADLAPFLNPGAH